jgi:hypothetical protein
VTQRSVTTWLSSSLLLLVLSRGYSLNCRGEQKEADDAQGLYCLLPRFAAARSEITGPGSAGHSWQQDAAKATALVELLNVLGTGVAGKAEKGFNGLLQFATSSSPTAVGTLRDAIKLVSGIAVRCWAS